MTKTIPATVAGRFYPSDARRLRNDIHTYLAAAPEQCRPKAIIAPHAGYDYSGPVAGYAYRQVQSVSHVIRRVLLLGTCHVRRHCAVIATSATAMATPLGEVPIDRDAVEQAQAVLEGQLVVDDEAHASDHSLQTQLPFLQSVLDTFAVAPLLVGAPEDERVAQLITKLGAGDDTLIVVSSDLSHFLSKNCCNQLDQLTAESIVALDFASIGPYQACGHHAVRALLIAAAQQRWDARLLTLRNSGDVTGCQSRVVGYGAFAMVASQT